jgi:hypothetical protein
MKLSWVSPHKVEHRYLSSCQRSVSQRSPSPHHHSEDKTVQDENQ